MECTKSLWSGYSPFELQRLPGSGHKEAVVIGAGVSGLSAAYALAQAGYECLVVDAAGIGAGMTACSTAHISAAVDGGWRKLLPRIGVANARALAQAYREGIEKTSHLAKLGRDGSDLHRVDGELLANRADLDVLAEEHAAATAVGLKCTSIAPSGSASGLCSIRFLGQARLHPTKYVEGLARELARVGVMLARAKLKAFFPAERGIALHFEDGQSWTADHAVFAHNMALDLKYPGVKLSRRRSYVIAARLPSHSIDDSITWDLASPYHYTRLAERAGEKVLLVGGADHASDAKKDEDHQFALVEEWMRKRFPQAGEVAWRWHGDIKQTPDGISVSGRMPGWDRAYVIDGDTGLGFNHALIGGQIVTDLIANRANPYMHIFDPLRVAS